MPNPDDGRGGSRTSRGPRGTARLRDPGHPQPAALPAPRRLVDRARPPPPRAGRRVRGRRVCPERRRPRRLHRDQRAWGSEPGQRGRHRPCRLRADAGPRTRNGDVGRRPGHGPSPRGPRPDSRPCRAWRPPRSGPGPGRCSGRGHRHRRSPLRMRAPRPAYMEIPLDAMETTGDAPAPPRRQRHRPCRTRAAWPSGQAPSRRRTGGDRPRGRCRGRRTPGARGSRGRWARR